MSTSINNTAATTNALATALGCSVNQDNYAILAGNAVYGSAKDKKGAGSIVRVAAHAPNGAPIYVWVHTKAVAEISKGEFLMAKGALVGPSADGDYNLYGASLCEADGKATFNKTTMVLEVVAGASMDKTMDGKPMLRIICEGGNTLKVFGPLAVSFAEKIQAGTIISGLGLKKGLFIDMVRPVLVKGYKKPGKVKASSEVSA